MVASIEMQVIKLVIADDHTLFRVGLKRILSMEKDILVVGEAADGDEAVKVVGRTQPDLLLLDLNMPSGDARQHLLKIAQTSPTTKVLFLTGFAEEANLLINEKPKARGILLKGISAATLLEAIRKVHQGGVWVDPDLPGAAEFERVAVTDSAPLVTPANETLKELSKREMEILRLVAEGMTNEEIGKKVFISELTVKTHLRNIFDKLHVKNRFKAALMFMQSTPNTPDTEH